MQKLQNYAAGKWVEGTGKATTLYNSITGEAIYEADSTGLDFSIMLDYARKVGGPALRKMTFHERGRMLKALAMFLNDKKEEFYKVKQEVLNRL